MTKKLWTVKKNGHAGKYDCGHENEVKVFDTFYDAYSEVTDELVWRIGETISNGENSSILICGNIATMTVVGEKNNVEGILTLEIEEKSIEV